MIVWADIQTALKTWFEAGTGIKVQWVNQMRIAADYPYATLQILTVGSVGEDELNYDTVIVGPDTTTVPTISGIRTFTLSCQVYSRNQGPDKDANYYLEKARVSLRNPVLRDALAAAGIAILGHNSNTFLLDKVNDNRVESRASLDLFMSLAQNVTYSDIDGGYMERAEVSSDIAGLNDPSENLDEEIYGVPV